MNINNIKAEIARAEAVIAKAQPLADKLAAMQAAVASIAEATKALSVLRAKLAEEAKAEQVREQALSRYSVERVAATGTGRYTVTFAERVTGLYGPEVRTMAFALDGLSSELLDVVLADLDKVPAAVLALDADPEQALRKHAQAVRRGYLMG